MQQRQHSAGGSTEPPIPIHLGVHLRLLRDRYGLSQTEIVSRLPGWQQAAYSRIEHGSRAPLFESLPQIWRALTAAGVQPTWQDREDFLALAREMVESRKTRHARRSEEEWSALREQLAQIDGLPLFQVEGPVARRTQQKYGGQSYRRESGHLLGRERWLAEVVGMITGPSIKALVLQGPPGSGKTSELHRLAHHFFYHLPRYRVVLSEPSPIQLERLEPADILEQLLGDVLGAVGSAYAAMPTTNVQARIRYMLECLTRLNHPLLILLDNAEHIFDAQGQIGTVWRRFLTQFLQASHQATLVLASQQWPAGTFLQESQLMATLSIPRLSRTEGSQLLQTLGMRNVSEELLGRAVDAVEGMPVCLEWMVRLIREPLLRDEWADLEEEGNERALLERLLEDPALFGGAVAHRIQPLLDRLLRRLSAEAMAALQDLAIAPIPLGAPALRVLYESPKLLSELRETSLLVAYPQRVQLLPMVAAQVRQGLSDDQVRAAEERLAVALMHWVTTSRNLDNREMGSIIAALAEIYLKQYRLLEAAQFIIRHGWLAFNLGHARRLAQGALKSIEEVRKQTTESLDVEQQGGRMLLYYFLAPFLGHKIDGSERVKDYQFILQALMEGTITLQPVTEVYLVRNLLAYTMSWPGEEHFEEAQTLFSTCHERMAPHLPSDPDLRAALYEIHALLLTRQCDYAEERGEKQCATAYRVQAIQLYQEACGLLTDYEQLPALTASLWKKRLAKGTTSLGYHLDQLGRYDEALPILEQSILLKEAGYVEPGSLASCYGEKSQVLAALGRYDEALHFDALAVEEVERLANAGDTLSQEERWIYLVNRACLYLQLQRTDEAEQLLKDAIPHIAETRRTYSVLADQTLKEIQAWREGAPSSPYQRDWRWIGRLRDAISYNAFWWLAHAGPFSSQEQQEWQSFVRQPAGEAVQKQRETIISQSRQRELTAAIAEKREPQLWYPAISIEEVGSRITRLLQLGADIQRLEANEIIRELYRGKIKEEVSLLHLIEASYAKDRERFWEMNQELHPAPTLEEMHYALSRVKRLVSQGLQQEQSKEAAEQVSALLNTQLHLSFDPQGCEMSQDELRSLAPSSGQPQRSLSARAAQRFFEAVLREGRCEGWQVIFDATAAGARIEAASHLFILPDRTLTLDECKVLLEHEVLNHIADSVAGESSPLGLLAVGTRDYLPILEGLALHHEMQAAKASGKAFDDSRIWLGAVSTGLAAGICTPAQSFFNLYTFLKAFLALFRLLRRPDEDRETVQRSAHSLAQTLCLRTFRGVPDLEKPGVCYSKDASYLRGMLLIQRELAKDETIIERLSIGRTALEYLPALERLGVKPALQPLRKLAKGAELDAYILSFEVGNQV